MDALQCSACGKYYNWTDRKPKALECGHAMCLKDVEELCRGGKPVKCQKDQISTNKRIEDFKDDHSLMEMLDRAEVRCEAHSTIAATFCLEHCLALCQDCRHPAGAGCRIKGLPEDLGEIEYTVNVKLEAMCKTCTPSPALRGKYERKGKMMIRELMPLYKEFAALAGPPVVAPPAPRAQSQRPVVVPNEPIPCETCKGPANGSLRCNDFKAYCQSHAGKNIVEGAPCVKLDGSVPEAEVCSQIAALFPNFLSKVNFYDLDLQTLMTVATPPPSPKVLRDLGLLIIRKGCTDKGTFTQAPDNFFCPSCLQPLRKDNASMRELRCGKALHAICEGCARDKGEQRAVCPLDKAVFGVNYTQLTAIGRSAAAPGLPQVYGAVIPPELQGYAQQASGAVIPPELQALRGSQGFPQVDPSLGRSGFVPSQMSKSGLPTQPMHLKGGLPTQPLYPAVPSVPQPMPRPAIPVQTVQPKPGPLPQQSVASPLTPPTRAVPQVPSPSIPKPPVTAFPAMPDIPKVSGTPLPPAHLYAGELVINRFPSVLPPMDISADRRTANQRGWYQTHDKNQVEAMVFVTSENLLLLGVSIAAPTSQINASIVDFVNIYRNRDTRVPPTYSHRGRERIQGGNQLLGDVRFAQPFQVMAGQQYSLKIKLSGDPNTAYETYRGNPFERPDIWITDDGVLWEFEECTLVEPGEYLNGQNNLSGPILRLIYRR